MSEKHTDTGIDPQQHAAKAAQDAAAAQAKAQAAHEKQQAARAEKEAQQAEKRAERVEDKAQDAQRAKDDDSEDSHDQKAAQGSKPAKKQSAKKAEQDNEKVEVVEKPIQPKQKPELDDETAEALEARAQKKAATPHFRRHEWWRYKRLGGKHAPWRRPRGIHSKQRRHFKYRPPVVSIGYRGPRAARGLHPSGFEEVLVYRPEDLGTVDPKTQAARVGGTVGGRKAERIEKEADKLGIRVLNRRSS